MEKTTDWSKWKDMLQVELWQAIALSLNIDPDSMTAAALSNHKEAPKRFTILEDNFHAPKARKDRRLSPVLAGRTRGAWLAGGGQPIYGVSLPDFASWALEKWGSAPDGIPAELANMATPQKSIAELHATIADQAARIAGLEQEARAQAPTLPAKEEAEEDKPMGTKPRRSKTRTHLCS